MLRKFLVLSLTVAVAAFSEFSCFIAYAADSGKSNVGFDSKDLPRYCKLPVTVPNNLTAKEYFDLAKDYADWRLPIQSRQCIDRLQKMNVEPQLKIKVDRLIDTQLPKQPPNVEAVLLNLKARETPPVKDEDMRKMIAGENDRRRFDQAIEICNRCIQKYPNFEYAYLTLANYQALNEDRQASVATYRKALKINPHNTEALVAMGDQLMSLNQFNDAKACFEAAFQYDPDDMMAKDRVQHLPDIEKASNPLQQAGNFISGMVGMFSLPSLLAARDSAAVNTSGFIDKAGKFLYHKLNCTQGRGYFNGILLDHDHYVDKSGKAISDKRFYPAEDFSEGLAAVCVNKDWGFLNTTGKYAVPLRYQDAKSFREGLAPVKTNGRWGFIDKTGKLIIQPKFDGALSFYEGLAAVVMKGKIGYVDHGGKMVIEPKYDVALSFSNGLAVVTIFETPIKRHHKLCIDKNGKTIFDLTAILQSLDNTKEFLSSGVVWDHGSPDEIAAENRDEPRMHFSNTQSDDPERFSEGLLLIKSRGKYGYLDKFGKLAIPCKFGSAEPFKEGVAPVSLDPAGDIGSSFGLKQSFGYIDKTGKFVIPPNFESAARFSEGLALVTDKKGGGGFIDHTGKVVIPVPHGYANDFHDGMAAVGETLYYP